MDMIFTLDEIDNIAKKIVPILNNSKIVAVNGAMGAGKTTFIHALCRQMGVVDKMSSPTYSVIQQYKTKDNLLINHIDIYRLKDTDEAIQAGVDDAINSGDFCFIEWPEKILNLLPLHFVNIFIQSANHAKRKLIVKN
ncbi:MAG: tRNA (adenosine(37)-N6)-threonylcarbamoyltransferase complex ATPase subunit type 1 TsaE [Ginsengibacter sp.]